MHLIGSRPHKSLVPPAGWLHLPEFTSVHQEVLKITLDHEIHQTPIRDAHLRGSDLVICKTLALSQPANTQAKRLFQTPSTSDTEIKAPA